MSFVFLWLARGIANTVASFNKHCARHPLLILAFRPLLHSRTSNAWPASASERCSELMEWDTIQGSSSLHSDSLSVQLFSISRNHFHLVNFYHIKIIFHSVKYYQQINILYQLIILFHHCLIILNVIIFILRIAYNSLNIISFASINQSYPFTILSTLIHYDWSLYTHDIIFCWYMRTHLSSNVSHTHHSINFEAVAIL